MTIDLLQQVTSQMDPAAARAKLETALHAARWRPGANDHIWVPRNVARLYREVLGDPEAARRVLGELAPLTCSEWRLAAAAWSEHGDVARATTCLEQASANARTAPDLCTIAMGYRDAGFLDEGRLLLDGAETIATRAIEHWTVATVHVAFGDRGRAIAALDGAVRDAVEVTELVTLAHALATFDVHAGQIANVLGERASTVGDWLELAVARDLLLHDREGANRCIVAASALATTAEHERAIAVTRGRISELELLDDDRPKLSPNKLMRAGARSFGWDRDASRLLGWLRARMPRATIEGLTQPSAFFISDDLVALLEIVKTGNVPNPLPAYLEVLHEVCWETGEGVDHLRRAFACTLLLIEDAAAAVPHNNEATIAILLESCLALGPGAVDGAIALFAAIADAYDVTQSTTRMAYMTVFAELGLVLAAAWLDPTDPRIAVLTARLIDDEARQRTRANDARAPWLVGLGPDRDELWRALAARILVHPRNARLAGLLRSA